MSANKAKINDWLTVGNCHSCPDDGYEIVIHIFRHDTGERQERCCVHPPTRHNMRMDYKDGRVIDPSNMRNLNDIVAKLKRRIRPTLVHCHAGMCRSPTVAIYLLVFATGMNPYDAHALVTRAIYEQRNGEVCNVVYEPFKQIVRLWEASLASARGEGKSV